MSNNGADTHLADNLCLDIAATRLCLLKFIRLSQILSPTGLTGDQG